MSGFVLYTNMFGHNTIPSQLWRVDIGQIAPPPPPPLKKENAFGQCHSWDQNKRTVKEKTKKKRKTKLKKRSGKRMISLVWYIFIYNVSEMICSSANFVVNIFWNWCHYGVHFQFGKLIFHRNVWWHRFPLGTACQNFPESESQLKLKFGAHPLFRSFDSPLLMSTSLIWQSSGQKIALQSIQQLNSRQLPQSSSAAKTVHLSFVQSQFQLLWPPLCICDRMVDARMHTEAICSQSFHKFQLKFPLPFSKIVKLFSNFSKIARMH